LQFLLNACADRRVQTGVFAGVAFGFGIAVALLQAPDIQAPARTPAPIIGVMAQSQIGVGGFSAISAPAAVNHKLQLDSRASELNCLTQAVYFEARGETQKGQAAVAEVIVNRVKHPAFPKTVCGVVYQGAATGRGCQFSFACDGAVERVSEDRAWDRAQRIAAQVLSGVVLADIGGATHFHTAGVSPAWGDHMRLVTRVGMHIFYRFGAPRGGVPSPAPQIEAAPEIQYVSTPTAPAITVTTAPLAEVKPAVESAPAHGVETVATVPEAQASATKA
jgi:hypothetical protein